LTVMSLAYEPASYLAEPWRSSLTCCSSSIFIFFEGAGSSRF
jgi:hypothetical protein